MTEGREEERVNVLLPKIRHTAIHIASRGYVITHSPSYSYLPRAIMPRDKCNLHIICQVSPEETAFTACLLSFCENRKGVSISRCVCIYIKREREGERDWDGVSSSYLLGKSHAVPLIAPRIIRYVISISSARFQTLSGLNGTHKLLVFHAADPRWMLTGLRYWRRFDNYDSPPVTE